MKEEKKATPEKTANGTNNLPDKEFKALVIRIKLVLVILIKVGKRIDEHSENYKKIKIENIKRNQS